MDIWKGFRGREDVQILDVGCGRHSPISQIIKSQRFHAIGLDIFEPNLREAKRKGIHQDVILGDATALPLKNKTFNLAVLIEVLEHLNREDGEKALAELERVSKETVLITTPVRKCVHHDYYGNPFEEHKYIWNIKDLRARGFTVRGKGIRGLTGGDRWWLSFPRFMRPLQYAIYILGTLVSYFFPALGESVIAWRCLSV